MKEALKIGKKSTKKTFEYDPCQGCNFNYCPLSSDSQKMPEEFKNRGRYCATRDAYKYVKYIAAGYITEKEARTLIMNETDGLLIGKSLSTFKNNPISKLEETVVTEENFKEVKAKYISEFERILKIAKDY
jgi:hypothetical protein